MSAWVIYWAIGSLFVIPTLDHGMVRVVRKYCSDYDVEFPDWVLLFLMFAAVCLSAFLWPLMIIPRRK